VAHALLENIVALERLAAQLRKHVLQDIIAPQALDHHSLA